MRRAPEATKMSVGHAEPTEMSIVAIAATALPHRTGRLMLAGAMQEA